MTDENNDGLHAGLEEGMTPPAEAPAPQDANSDTDRILEEIFGGISRAGVPDAAEEQEYAPPGTMYSHAAQTAEPEQRMSLFLRIVLWLLVLAVIDLLIQRKKK